MSSERAANLTVALSQSVQRVKLRNAMKFQQYRNIRFSDDFSIICRHHMHLKNRISVTTNYTKIVTKTYIFILLEFHCVTQFDTLYRLR